MDIFKKKSHINVKQSWNIQQKIHFQKPPTETFNREINGTTYKLYCTIILL